MADLARVQARISGRVQGVGFRYSTLDQARRLGLAGWVRNTPDGEVEVLAEGDRQRLQQLVDWCRAGPRGAEVTDVQVSWSEAQGRFDDFDIRF